MIHQFNFKLMLNENLFYLYITAEQISKIYTNVINFFNSIFSFKENFS